MILVLLVVWSVVYLPSAGFGKDLFFDDAASIAFNETVQGTWGESWWPKKNSPTASRPLSNASLWINYQWTGLDPWSYLLVNRVLHLVTGLLLLGLTGLTLIRFGGILAEPRTLPLAAGSVALLWLLHPLTTDITGYATQRTEVLGALFLILAWWLAVRAWWSSDPARWGTFAVIAAMVGVLAKEVTALAFALVLMWDLAFAPGRWGQVIRRRWPLYVALFVGPAVVLWLILRTDPYPKSIGFHHEIGPWEYLLTQGQVILLYLKLSVWPVGLSMWHEVPWRRSLSAAWPTVLPVAVLVLISFAFWVPRRTRWLGFLLLTVFVLLGPTSSIIPIITEPAAERRMYLPVAALIAAVVLPMLAWLARRRLLDVGAVLVAAGCIAYTSLTWNRLGELETAESAWLHVLYLYPHSHFAASGVGQSFLEESTNVEVANRYYERAFKGFVQDWRVAHSYGRTLNLLRRWKEAIPVLERAVNIAREDHPDGLATLGDAYVALKDEQNALDAFAKRVDIDTTNASYLNDLGVALAHFDRYQEAVDTYVAARQKDPMLGIVALNLGDALLKVDRPDLAEPQLYDAIQLIDDEEVLWGAYGKRGLALSRMGRLDEAIAAYERSVQLFDKDAETWNNFGVTLGRAGRLDEAVSAFEQALAIDPEYEEPRENLAIIERLKGETAAKTE